MSQKILGHFCSECNVTNVTSLTLWKNDYFLMYCLSQTSQQNNPLGPANPAWQRHKCHSKILGHFCSDCNVTNVTRLTLWKSEYSLMISLSQMSQENNLLGPANPLSQCHKCHSKILGHFCSDCNVTNVTRLSLWEKEYSLMFSLSQTSQQNNPLGPANSVSQGHKCHSKILGHFCSNCNVTNVTRLTLRNK